MFGGRKLNVREEGSPEKRSHRKIMPCMFDTGSTVMTLLHFGICPQIIVSGMPQHGFGLAVFGNHLYWTDWVLRSVIRANKYTGGDVVYLRKSIARQPMGIVAVAKDSNNCEHSKQFHLAGLCFLGGIHQCNESATSSCSNAHLLQEQEA